MWMADPHVISALREKRALVSGLIEKLERKLEQHRADLTHIDDVLRLFQPDRDPGEIKPKPTYARRTRYFARNELSRLTMYALRLADGGLQTTDEIAVRVIEAQGLRHALRGSIRDQVLTLLRSYRERGMVGQVGLGRGVRLKITK
jgi:CRP-like cAMP-binding protein